MPSSPRRGDYVAVVCFVILAGGLLAGCAGATSGGADPPTGNPVPPTVSVSLSPTTASVEIPGTQAFTATVANDSSNKGVDWTLSGSGCAGAACGTLSATSSTSGVAITYTAAASLPTPPIITITATSATDSRKSAAATITLTQPPIAVSVVPATATVSAGGTQKFTAMVQNDLQNKGVSWALSGAGCTGNNDLCGDISVNLSASGQAITYTAPASVPSPMNVTLTATSASDVSKSKAATIIVSPTPPVLSVSILPTGATVAETATQQFTATVQNDPQNKGVTWAFFGSACEGALPCYGTLSAQSSASGTPVTYTAPTKAVGPVTLPAAITLTATSVTDATKAASIVVTITGPPAPTVKVSPTSATVSINGTQPFSATLTNDPQNLGVNWSLSGSGCSGSTCGSVAPASSASGATVTYTPPASAPAPPTVTLTATSVADGTATAKAKITIAAQGSVSLMPLRAGIPVSQSQNFTATVAGDVNNQGVTWSVTGSNCTGTACGSFTGVLTPSTSAGYKAPATAGVYTVTATSVAFPQQSASATIGVTDLPGVLTYHNDLSRNGVNAQEYALTPSTVGSATFGKLFSCPVDGAIYAQPLWVPDLNINGTVHNAVFVATQHDSLYAFDADANPCAQLWHVNLINQAHGASTGETPVPTGTNVFYIGQGAGDIMPEVGVTGTPVIDPSTSTLYVISKSMIPFGPTFFQRIHAIDLSTGNEKFAAPVAIGASVPGNAPDAVNGVVTFNPGTQNQRPSLALVNDVVYVAWASHEDQDPWHGWVIGYQVVNSALSQVAVFNTTPNAVTGLPYARGGIWMSGGAPAADTENNLYLITGNGAFDGVSDFGDTLLKLGTSNGLSLLDWFTPSDQAQLDADDLDFGSGGAVVFLNVPVAPVPHLLIGGGKQGSGNPGEIFVLNADGPLGGINGTDSQVLEKFSTNNQIFSTPAFWNNTLYIAPVSSNLLSYSFDSVAFFSTSASAQSSSPAAGFGFPGATPSVSASTATNGIVWALDNTLYCTAQAPAPTFCGPTVLHAYDATNLSELWNSAQAVNGQDQAGFAVKFTVPTVANGKVYIGTRGADGVPGAITVTGGVGELDVYGLLPN